MSRRSSSLHLRVGVVLLLAGALGTAWSQAQEAAPGAEQVQTWIRQLGDENYQKREEARAALTRAGATAVAALKAVENSPDIEIRNAAKRLLSELQWQTLRPDVNYLTAIPGEAVIAIRLKDLSDSVARSRETALGKLLSGPDFKPAWDLLKKQFQGVPNPMLPPNVAPLVEKWAARFSGQVAAALWAFDPRPPEPNVKAALIAELTGGDPAKIYDELLAETGIGAQGIATPSNGLKVLVLPGMGAVALAGKHLIVATNRESVDEVARGLLGAAGSLNDSPAFQKLKPQLGAEPDLLFLMNFPAYLKMVSIMPGAQQMGDMMSKMGYDALDFMAMSSRVAGDRFEDRFVMVFNERPSKLVELMSKGSTGTTSLKEALAVVPANAVAVFGSYLDGQAMYAVGFEYMKGMLETYKAMGMQMPDLDVAVKNIEDTLNLKLADLAGAIKGDLAYWARLAPTLGPPDIGISIGCVDAAKAQWLAETLSKLTDVLARSVVAAQPGAPLPAAMTKADRGGRAIYAEADDSPLMKFPVRAQVPYRVCWSAHGSRVVLGSSPAVVDDRLNALDAKTPGFDPAKVLPATPEAAGAKNLVALDVAGLLNYAAKFGLPILAGALQNNPEGQAVVAGLMQKPDLFNSVPPLVLTMQPPKDGVQTSTMWSPTPYLPTAFGVVGVAVVLGINQARPPQPVPPPQAPAGQNF